MKMIVIRSAHTILTFRQEKKIISTWKKEKKTFFPLSAIRLNFDITGKINLNSVKRGKIIFPLSIIKNKVIHMKKDFSLSK